MHPGVDDLLGLVFDAGSFEPWDTPPVPTAKPEEYAAAWRRACERTGRDEAAVTGSALLAGRRVAVLAGDPDFLGGSIGVATAERLTAAVERATAERLPLIAFPVGGGTRMQEGTIAFLQMVKITLALTRHKDAGLPYLVYLRHPTMGGVFASWGSLGHVQLAEPGALIGFLGPRVYEALYGRPFPDGVQVAENLEEHGIVDAVVPPAELREVLDRILVVIDPRDEPAPRTPPPRAASAFSAPPPDTWAAITATRSADRPGVRDLLARAASDVTMLNGTGEGATHPGSVLALARFGGIPCVVVGQCRQGQTLDNPLDPGALREARRGMRLSRELGLPLVTLIDTPGAALSRHAEENGLAGEIARTLVDLVTLPTPTLSVLLGQGSGGIALALAPCDRILATENGWLAPLPPEGASAIVHRDTDHAAEVADAQGVRAHDLQAAGIVDRIIPEAGGRTAAFCRAVGDAVAEELQGLVRASSDQRLAERRRRFGSLGVPRTCPGETSPRG